MRHLTLNSPWYELVRDGKNYTKDAGHCLPY